ncbi:hypothetical protein GCWU000323_01371 [Leptotrichia hofstadii F0254]|uniref:Uncharacterized protein n=1 Tax=Leptotrichia hofstadii F0254 TaxID=634994 RepID=C9MXU9_9FUSO|nr:hypothetical protein GCWU000323_01371 [Leptotrichia hofstadii F0254]
MGFEQSNFNEYEGDSIEDIFDNFLILAIIQAIKVFLKKHKIFQMVLMKMK